MQTHRYTCTNPSSQHVAQRSTTRTVLSRWSRIAVNCSREKSSTSLREWNKFHVAAILIHPHGEDIQNVQHVHHALTRALRKILEAAGTKSTAEQCVTFSLLHTALHLCAGKGKTNQTFARLSAGLQEHDIKSDHVVQYLTDQKMRTTTCPPINEPAGHKNTCTEQRSASHIARYMLLLSPGPLPLPWKVPNPSPRAWDRALAG